MNTLEKANEIFSIFHDGNISAWNGDTSCLNLTIECKYLAERIHSDYELFYVELKNIDNLVLEPWTKTVHPQTILLTDYTEIFEYELEILSCNLNNNELLITCHISPSKNDYTGGNLYLSFQTISVFDEVRNELTLEQLASIADGYWKSK